MVCCGQCQLYQYRKRLKADDGWGGSLRLGKQINQWFDIQAGIGYSRADAETISGSYHQTSASLDGLFFFTRNSIRPFVLGGFGIANNDLDYQGVVGDSSRTSGLFNVGLGLQADISPRIGLQADVRQVWSRSNGQVPAANIDANGTSSNTVFNVGITIKLSAEKQSAEIKKEPLPPESPPSPPPVKDEVIVDDQPPPPETQESPPEPPPPCDHDMKVVISDENNINGTPLFAFDRPKKNAKGYQDLSVDAQKMLDEKVITPLLNNHGSHPVFVIGHTDRIGSAPYNQGLSERRTEAVKTYLIHKGIAAERIKPQGRGEDDPVTACQSVKGAALNKCLLESSSADLVQKCSQKKGIALTKCLLAPDRRVEVRSRYSSPDTPKECPNK